MKRKIKWLVLFFASLLVLSSCQQTETTGDDVTQTQNKRILFAEVVALDQPITYNRFGSYNPYGMIYALKRDVVDTEKCSLNIPSDEENCSAMSEESKPGHVRLHKNKRPRPLVLRASPGDQLQVKFYNMLMPNQPDSSSPETPIPNTGMNLTFSDIGKPEVEEPVALAAETEAHPAPVEGKAATEGCGSD